MNKLLIPALLGFAFQANSAFALNSADAKASFDWSAVTVNLIDLDPNDGLSPSVTWSGQYGDTSASSSSYEVGHSSSISDGYHAPSAASVVSSSANTFAANAGASFDNLALTLGAHAEESANPATYWQQNYGNASGSTHTSFSLSGAGVLVISVPYSIEVTGNRSNYDTYSRAYMNISGNYSSSDGSFSGNENANKSFYSYSTGDKSYSGMFTMAVANPGGGITTSGYLNTSLSTNAYANQYSYVPGVPEPDSYAMMLAGLAMIGSVIRRRMR